MTSASSPTPRADALVAALRAAAELSRGVPADLEAIVRAFAVEEREAGKRVEEMLLDAKALVRDTTGRDEPLFTPKVVGWSVAGYFSGRPGRRNSGEQR